MLYLHPLLMRLKEDLTNIGLTYDIQWTLMFLPIDLMASFDRAWSSIQYSVVQREGSLIKSLFEPSDHAKIYRFYF